MGLAEAVEEHDNHQLEYAYELLMTFQARHLSPTFLQTTGKTQLLTPKAQTLTQEARVQMAVEEEANLLAQHDDSLLITRTHNLLHTESLTLEAQVEMAVEEEIEMEVGRGEKF